MYLTNDGFVVSGREIILIIFAMSVIIAIFISFGRIIRYIISKRNDKYDDYPGSSKFEDIYQDVKLDTDKSDISDTYDESDLNRKWQEKVIFEETISNVPFRYDERTKVLTIGERFESSTEPINVKLNSLNDLREFVDRLENYVNE